MTIIRAKNNDWSPCKECPEGNNPNSFFTKCSECGIRPFDVKQFHLLCSSTFITISAN